MDRREFIVNSCTACLGLAAIAALISSCTSTRFITGTLNDDGLLISSDEFKTINKGQVTYRRFIVVRNEALQYPICLYRFNEEEYSALWMQCSHQGAELQASGDFLQCSAHGSEFTNKGQVTNGPADRNLRTFPVSVNNNQLFIDLRKQ